MKPTVTERKNHPGTYKIVLDKPTLHALTDWLGGDPSNATDALYTALMDGPA